MDFDPINDDHAIQSAIFTCGLNAPIGPLEIRQLQMRHALIRDDLPAIGMPQAINVDLEAPFPMQRAQQGIEFSILRPDGTPVWALRAVGAEITVECTRYTRWEKTWDQAKHFLLFAAQSLTAISPDRAITNVALQVADKFKARRDDYDISSLLKPNEFVSTYVAKRSALWHIHTGWYEDTAASSTLNRLNLDARREPTYLADKHEIAMAVFVTLDHAQFCRLLEPFSMSSMSERLDSVMLQLHDANKKMAINLLSERICRQIGLEEPIQ